MSIRLLIIFFLFTLSNEHGLFAQTKLDKVNHIQDIFRTINNTPGLKSIRLENEEFLDHTYDGGGELIGFFKKDSLLKISEWVGLSYGAILIDYYFENNKLVFSYVQEKYFPITDSGEIDRSKLILKFEGRYYYQNDEIIAQKNSGSGMWGDSLDKSNPILQDSKRYSKLLLAKLK